MNWVRNLLLSSTFLITTVTQAQTPGTFVTRQVLTATELNSAFATKQDYATSPSGTVKCNNTASAGPATDCTSVILGTGTSNGGLTINPLTHSTNMALDTQSSGPITGSQSAGLNYNLMSCTDNYSITTLGNSDNCLEVFFNYGGSNTSGSHSAMFVWGRLSTQPTTNSPFYGALQVLQESNAPAGGTAPTPLGALGASEGVIAFAQLGPTATNYSSLVGAELTVQALTGSSTLARHGTSLVSFGQVQATNNAGVQEDDAVHIGSGGGGTVSWVNGIYLSHWNGIAPLDSNGYVINSDGQNDTINSVINLPAWTVTGSYLSFKNFAVDGPTGAPTVFPATGRAALQLNNVDSTHDAEIIFEANSTSVWEMGKDGSGKFFVFDNTVTSNAMTIATGASGVVTLNRPIGLPGTSSGTITLQTQANSGTYNWNWPITAGSASQVLTSQAGGSTAMTWTTLAASATTDTTNASNISSGTLNAARLPANGANPSASVGLSAVNGSATTWMRSDAAPALDQTISPTWTGTHIWTGPGPTAKVTSGSASFWADDHSGGNNAEIQFQQAEVSKWELGKDGSANFFLFDDAGGQNALSIIGNGNMTISPKGGTTTVTGTLNVTAAYQINGTAGSTCAGTPTSSFASTNGIVTHC